MEWHQVPYRMWEEENKGWFFEIPVHDVAGPFPSEEAASKELLKEIRKIKKAGISWV